MGKISLQPIVWRASWASLASIAISFLVASLVISEPGGAFRGTALVMCIVCPVLIAWPVSFYTHLQRARLAKLVEELRAAHADLSAAHAELATTHSRLEEKSRRDDMTDLLNREAFFCAMEDARRRSTRGALLIMDADNFKAINDAHGHLVGDEALRLIAAAMRRAVRDNDLLGRVGGEEFAAYIAGADDGEAARVAERMRREVAKIDYRVAGQTVPLSISIGGSQHRQGAGMTELLREADRRLYRAKEMGRNRIMMEDGIGAAA